MKPLLIGTILKQDVVNPYSGEIVAEAGDILDDQLAERIAHLRAWLAAVQKRQSVQSIT